MSFEGWALVEIMGHQRAMGRCSEETIAGATMLRVDVPAEEGDGFTTTYLGGPSIFRLTPLSEERVRAELARERAWNRPSIATLPEHEDEDLEEYHRANVGEDAHA